MNSNQKEAKKRPSGSGWGSQDEGYHREPEPRAIEEFLRRQGEKEEGEGVRGEEEKPSSPKQ